MTGFRRNLQERLIRLMQQFPVVTIVDLILHGAFGVLPVEIKYGSTVQRGRLRSLRTFIQERQLPLGLVVNQSTQAEWLTPDVLQLPAGWL